MTPRASAATDGESRLLLNDSVCMRVTVKDSLTICVPLP